MGLLGASPSVAFFRSHSKFLEFFGESRNNEAFVWHTILHGRACKMADDQRAAFSNRIREYQVILLLSTPSRFGFQWLEKEDN